MSEIIRAYELKKMDLFIKQCVLYLVVRITDKEIHYCSYNEDWKTYAGTSNTMGRYSKERVEYVGSKIKKEIPQTEEDIII